MSGERLTLEECAELDALGSHEGGFKLADYERYNELTERAIMWGRADVTPRPFLGLEPKP